MRVASQQRSTDRHADFHSNHHTYMAICRASFQLIWRRIRAKPPGGKASVSNHARYLLLNPCRPVEALVDKLSSCRCANDQPYSRDCDSYTSVRHFRRYFELWSDWPCNCRISEASGTYVDPDHIHDIILTA